MKLLTEICSLPTAPFAERHVVDYVERFVKARRNLKLSRDQTGNLLIELPGRPRSKQPRWVFTAHMDHPGMVAEAMRDRRTLDARFHGGVHIDYVRGAKVRFFSDGGEITGVITDAAAAEDDRITVPRRVTVRVKSPVAPGSVGMFDQGTGRTRGAKFFSRAIDDLGGLASALAMLDRLAKGPPPESTVAVLLTRAEEEAFIGAIAAVLRPQLLRKSDRVIAIECSAMQPYARQGDGVIIRVGDKTSVFNSALTYFLTQQAEALARKDKRFKFQRALMPGGTCEATVYDAYGYTAAAACVALGNYHNMDRQRRKIGPEYIDVADWKNMVKLFVHLARAGHAFDPGNRALRDRVEKRFEKLKHLL